MPTVNVICRRCHQVMVTSIDGVGYCSDCRTAQHAEIDALIAVLRIVSPRPVSGNEQGQEDLRGPSTEGTEFKGWPGKPVAGRVAYGRGGLSATSYGSGRAERVHERGDVARERESRGSSGIAQ